jgi:hypothetical protein
MLLRWGGRAQVAARSSAIAAEENGPNRRRPARAPGKDITEDSAVNLRDLVLILSKDHTGRRIQDQPRCVLRIVKVE